MRLNSIITKISLIFFIALIFLCILLIFGIKNEQKFIAKQAINNHKNISSYSHRHRLSKVELVDYMEDLNFELNSNARMILDKGRVIFSKRGIETILYRKNLYIYIKTPHSKQLFKDLNSYEKTYLHLYIFAFALALLVFVYLWLLRSLKPLSELKENITRFGQGELSIRCNSKGKDEIADVSNEFDAAATKINLLLNSRQLFLRTVMHELKTPVAKGRIVSELIEDEKQKTRMATIFGKLDFLINDFAKVEQVVSQNYKVNLKKINISKIIEYSKSFLILEDIDEKIVIDIENDLEVNADVELLAMAFKNLIDNALKYSTNTRVSIKIEDNYISFSSRGEELSKPIEEYFEPFHNDTSSKNHGMGLGLYIIKSILDLHGFNFEYKYKLEKNEFKIIF